MYLSIASFFKRKRSNIDQRCMYSDVRVLPDVHVWGITSYSMKYMYSTVLYLPFDITTYIQDPFRLREKSAESSASFQ